MARYEKAERKDSGRTGWIDALSFGFFVMAFGAMWLFTPSLWDKAVAFVNSFEQSEVFNVKLPTPIGDHSTLYNAFMFLALTVAALQIVVLALRFVVHDSVRKKADAVSGVASGFAVAYFLNLLVVGSIEWWGFVSGLIICAGLSLVVSGLVRLLASS
jgi:hypothetical protein